MAEKGVVENGLPPAGKRIKTRLSSMMMAEEDRISKLPDAIILHILSFLPTKDVVPTSLLSKRWKLMWYSVPTLSFSHTDYVSATEDVERFCKYVDNCLEHRKKGMFFIPHSAITSFKIHVFYSGRIEAGRLDKWLAFAVENKVKEISITFVGKRYYCLPKSVVVNAIYLTILELSKVKLDSRWSFNFPLLKSLSLEFVSFTDNIDVVDKLLLGSPSLEKLRLCHCILRTGLHLRSLRLKFLEIKIDDHMVDQIEVVNLESLTLQGIYFNKINLSVCKAIRNLTLNYDWGMKESISLEYLISNLPLLENLTLINCNRSGLRHIKISSHHLKSFKLNNNSEDGLNVIIESAPKLKSFCYRGSIKFSISMLESSSLLNGTFIIHDEQKNYDGNWFINMINLFLNLNCSWNTISMHVDSVEALILPENLKRFCRSPLVNWEHLRVTTECKPERESELRDTLLWISPSLKTLSIAKRGIF